MKRAAIIVLDSVGIGELPDAAKYGDQGSNTLVNIKKNYPVFNVPNMASLGLGNIEGTDIDLRYGKPLPHIYRNGIPQGDNG